MNAAQTPDRRSMAEGLAVGKDIIRNHLRGEPLDRTSLTMGIQGLAFFERQGSRNYPLSENLFYSPPTFRVFSELPNIGLQSRILEHPRSP